MYGHHASTTPRTSYEQALWREPKDQVTDPELLQWGKTAHGRIRGSSGAEELLDKSTWKHFMGED